MSIKLEPLDDALVIWTIYEKPLDYPDEFVARAHVTSKGQEYVSINSIRGKTLNEVRDQLTQQYPGLVCMQRHPDDPKHIVETWL